MKDSQICREPGNAFLCVFEYSYAILLERWMKYSEKNYYAVTNITWVQKDVKRRS
jgi:hypothetical protein